MYHIVLVNPPRSHVVSLDLPDFVDLGDISSFPPIGLMYLAQALRNLGPEYRVTILDAVARRLDSEQTAQWIADSAPDVIGLTAFTFTFHDVLETARAIKRRGLSAPVVVGGPHMYLFARETMTHDAIDAGVVGDGEAVFAAYCQALKEGRQPQALPSLLVRGQPFPDEIRPAVVQDLDAVQIPAVDLIEHQLYFSTLGKHKAVGTICSSRGCPFHCTFCQVPHTKYRTRAVANVVDEMEAYIALGITDFFFFDDLFNLTKKRVAEFSREVLRRNLKVGWMFRGRVDQIDREMMTLAVKAGCHTVSVGVEDATDEGLRRIRKNITIAQAKAAVRAIRASGARCSTNWIIGFPHHETQADLDRLLRVAIDIDADYAQFSILQCMPGSELYDEAVAEGGLDPRAWAGYVLHPTPDFQPPIWEKHFNKAELFAAYSRMYKRYYMRPKVFWRELVHTASLAELRRKADLFFRFFLSKTGRHGKKSPARTA
jgi:anaerobic magnesium-protoporphyrin IX monomethyl ester cyclase